MRAGSSYYTRRNFTRIRKMPNFKASKTYFVSVRTLAAEVFSFLPIDYMANNAQCGILLHVMIYTPSYFVLL